MGKLGSDTKGFVIQAMTAVEAVTGVTTITNESLIEMDGESEVEFTKESGATFTIVGTVGLRHYTLSDSITTVEVVSGTVRLA